MSDPRWSHLHSDEQQRLAEGLFNREELEALKRGENPWPKPTPQPDPANTRQPEKDDKSKSEEFAEPSEDEAQPPYTGTRVISQQSDSANRQDQLEYERKRREAELLRFMPEQLRAEYEKASPERREMLWGANERAFEDDRTRKQEKLLAEQELTIKALAMLQRVREDPSKSDLLPAANADLLEWYKDMSKTQDRPDFGNPPDRELGLNVVRNSETREVGPRARPKSGMQGLRDEVDRASKVMGEAAELLRHKTPKPPADELSTRNKSDDPHPSFFGRTKSWLKRNPGWVFVGGSLAMAGAGEYLVAEAVLLFAFVAFAMQISEWSSHIKERWVVLLVKGLWLTGVVLMLMFFGAVFYKMKGPKPWSNLLTQDDRKQNPVVSAGLRLLAVQFTIPKVRERVSTLATWENTSDDNIVIHGGAYVYLVILRENNTTPITRANEDEFEAFGWSEYLKADFSDTATELEPHGRIATRHHSPADKPITEFQIDEMHKGRARIYVIEGNRWTINGETHGCDYCAWTSGNGIAVMCHQHNRCF
jgi:hypothetical protein